MHYRHFHLDEESDVPVVYYKVGAMAPGDMLDKVPETRDRTSL